MIPTRISTPDDELELTVIIPCHNEAETLPQQLESLLAQEWDRRWDIVVVDNRSTDGTAAVATEYSSGTIDIRVVPATERAGIAYARNTGVRATTARSVAFCDGDDIVLPGWTKAIGEALRTEALVTGTLDAESLNEPWLARTRPMGCKDSLPRFGEVPFARGANTGMHRSLWSELDGYDEEFDGLEDIEFSIRAAGLGVTPTLVSDARVAYRFRSGLVATWRQGIYYGRGRPRMAAQAAALGLTGPTRSAGLRSWLWLIAKLPSLRDRSARHAWIFTLANRWGSLRGALRNRRART